MKKQQASDKKHSQIRILVNWQYTQEPSPAFKRLISLLLQKSKEIKKEVNDD